MSRNIYRRAIRTGLVSADIVRPGVESLSDLEALAPNDIWDGTLIHVRSINAIFYYDLESTATPNGATVIEPATGVGRWLGASKEDLASTLVVGNTTGGTDIEVSTGDEIVGQTDLVLRAPTDSDLTLNAAGTGSVVVTAPDLVVDSGSNLVSIVVGTGDPNGVVTAVTGSLFFDATTPGLYQNDAGGTAWTAVGGGGGSGWPTTTGTDYAGMDYEQAAVTAVNGNIVLSPNGTGSILAQVPDGTATGGNSRGDYSVDLQRVRTSGAEVASGLRSVICGGYRNVASGLDSVICGGHRNVASGSRSTVSGGYRNNATNSNSTVGGGRFNTASGDYSTVSGGGFTNFAGGRFSYVGAGRENAATGIGSIVCGGRAHTASGIYSTVGGGFFGQANHYGEFVHASGRFTAQGDAQYSRMVLRRETTDATPLELSADGNAPTGTDRLNLAVNTCYKFRIDLAARENATGDTAWWEITGCIKQGGSAATTALVGSLYTTTDADPGAAAWSVAVTADTVNGALAVTVTGEALHTIRWVATVHSTKVSG